MSPGPSSAHDGDNVTMTTLSLLLREKHVAKELSSRCPEVCTSLFSEAQEPQIRIKKHLSKYECMKCCCLGELAVVC